jgi:hypothetical protein
MNIIKKIFSTTRRLFTESLVSIGDGGISDLIKSASSLSLELLSSSSSSSSIRTIDG